MSRLPQNIEKAFQQLRRLSDKYELAENDPDLSPLTEKERESFHDYSKQIHDFFEKEKTRKPSFDFAASHVREFWRAEYIKRQFFLDLSEQGTTDFKKHELFSWISQLQDTLVLFTGCVSGTPNDCPFKTASSGDRDPNTPFFYSTGCNDCGFMEELKCLITTWHNMANPGIDTYLCGTTYTPNCFSCYTAEFSKAIEVLHQYSYKYGLFAFDFFKLTSPRELLEDTDRIHTISPAESFIKKGDQECDPEVMTITRRELSDSTIPEATINQLVNDYELVLGVPSTVEDAKSLKKAANSIKKQIEGHCKALSSKTSLTDLRNAIIVFSFNPSSKRFRLNDVISLVKITIASYSSYYNFDAPTIELENDMMAISKYIHIHRVKGYQEKNTPRAAGLHIWDQVHYQKRPINDTIWDFVNSSLYETAMQLDEDDILVRNGNEEVGESRGSQDAYNDIYRLYEYASCCIKEGAVLTGAECEKMLPLKKHTPKAIV